MCTWECADCISTHTHTHRMYLRQQIYIFNFNDHCSYLFYVITFIK